MRSGCGAEICEPVMTFTALFGAQPTLFRPPYGNSSGAVRRVAAGVRLPPRGAVDGSTNVGKLTMQDVVLKPGDIILMHYRDARRRPGRPGRPGAPPGFRIGRLEDYLRAQ